MGLTDRLSGIARAVLKTVSGYPAEGEYRPGPWYLPVTHGWLGADRRQFNEIAARSGYTPD